MNLAVRTGKSGAGQVVVGKPESGEAFVMAADTVCCRRRLLPLAVGLALVWLQPACRKMQEAASRTEEAKNVQAGLFTVPPDQVGRLKTAEVRATNWPVAIHTTGT